MVIIASAPQRSVDEIISHCDLAAGAVYLHNNTLYVSVSEAISLELNPLQAQLKYRCTDVTVRLNPTPEDNAAVADVRSRSERRWKCDPAPDYWTRPLPKIDSDVAMPPTINGVDPELIKRFQTSNA